MNPGQPSGSSPGSHPSITGLTNRQWRTEVVFAVVSLLLVLMSALGILLALGFKAAGVAEGPDATFYSLLGGLVSLQIPALVLAHVFLRLHDRNWVDGFGLRFNRRAFAWGLAVGVGSVLVCYPIERGLVEILRAMGRTPEPQKSVQFLATAPAWQQAIIGFAALLPAAVSEESLFRGILYSAARDTGRRGWAIAGTAVLFGLAHAHGLAFVPLTLFGAVLAWTYERTGNLACCWIAHATFNSIGFTAAVSGWGR